MPRPLLLIGILLIALPGCAHKPPRSAAQRAAFIRTHPCPAGPTPDGTCPGYIVDHIIPLCAGGQDTPANMQWQTAAAAQAKDRDERRLCRSAPQD